MKKIPTLFKKNPENLALVLNEIDPVNQWVFDGEGIATRKYDGAACAVIAGELYKRYDVKEGRKVPDGAIPCQAADPITGHWPHWVRCNVNDKADRWFFDGLDNLIDNSVVSGHNYPNEFDGTYELIGEKIQGNPEGIPGHILIKHGITVLPGIVREFEWLKAYLMVNDIEGIVFHHPDGRMCKIRKSDFGIKRKNV